MADLAGPYLLGIDIGGSGAKAGLFALDGYSIGHGHCEYEMTSTLPPEIDLRKK